MRDLLGLHHSRSFELSSNCSAPSYSMLPLSIPEEMNNVPDITAERSYLCFREPPNGMQRRKYQRYAKSHSTYLGLIASVIQKSPNKRLTFCQIMDNLVAFVSGDRMGLVNNIRVCLSSNDCFMKVPINPDHPNSKRNFWTVDESRITPKMLRRHFKGMLDIFPALVSSVKRRSDDSGENDMIPNAPKPSVSVIKKEYVKFSGPFSIESILKKDTRPHPHPNYSALYILPSASDRESQHLRPRVQETQDTTRPLKRMRLCPDLLFTMFPRERIASQFQHSQNINFTNNLHFPLNAYTCGQ